MKNRVPLEEYHLLRARESSSLRQNDEVHDAYKQAVQAIRDLQGLGIDMLFDGSVAVHAEYNGSTKADADNILKGIADALQGFAFANDKQVKETSIRLNEG